MIEIQLLQFNSTLSASFEEVIRDSDAFLERINPKGELLFGDKGLPVFFIRTGGSEEWFLKRYEEFSEPYFILAQGERNSLAASLEIVSFLHQLGKKAILLYGDEKKIGEELLLYGSAYKAKEELASHRYGVIGTPSDWLIASQVDYDKAKRLFGVTLIDIPIEEMYNRIDKHEVASESLVDKFSKLSHGREEDVKVSLFIHEAIKEILDEYRLNGFTLRCFSLLEKYKNTSCLAFALFNEDRRIAACEGDVPSLLSMAILDALTEEPIFMANPARIDLKERVGTYAHCTCPFSMLKEYHLHTHFESGLGFGVKGEFYEKEVTMFKLDPSLKSYVVKEGKIIRNLSESNLCRSQIVVKFDEGIDDLISDPHGNHMLFIYGHHKKLIEKYLELVLG